jgi:hypothetical protein
LISHSELRSFKIWNGHFKALKEIFQSSSFPFQVVDIPDIDTFTFQRDDVVINIGNHQYFGSEILNKVAEKLGSVKRTVFFMDDYQSPPPTQLRKAVLDASNILITNIQDVSNRRCLNHFQPEFVDLNKLSFHLLSLKDPLYKRSFIYWGSYRKGREDYYYKYFKPNLYPTYVSSSIRGHKKFESAYLDYRYLEKLNLPDDLQKYGFTVYMKDDKQPKICPANRFYESISAGLPIFFERNCLQDFENVPEAYIMDSPENIPLNNLNQIQVEQRKLWGNRDYRTEAKTKIADILKTHDII